MDLKNLQQYGTPFSNIEHVQHVLMNGKRGETVSQAARRVKWNGRAPDAIINAELFNRYTYKLSSGLVSGGKNLKLTDTNGFAFVNGVKPVFSYKNNVQADDWVGSYGDLLIKGKYGFKKEPIGLGGKKARSALAISNTYFAFFYVKKQHACNMWEFADAIKARGFHTAINLDGGGSTACITPGVAYDQYRKVHGFVALWVKNGVGNRLAR